MVLTCPSACVCVCVHLGRGVSVWLYVSYITKLINVLLCESRDTKVLQENIPWLMVDF